MTMRAQIALGTVLAAIVGVVLAGLVALGLVRHAYDGEARQALHREAVLAATALSNSGRLAPVRALRAVGVRVVWVADPVQRTVTVYRRDRGPQVLAEEDTLTVEDIIPGFRMAVRDVFQT